VQKTLELVESFPGTGARIPMVTGKARRLPVAGFPYHVVFEELLDRVEVLAIAHDRKRDALTVRPSERKRSRHLLASGTACIEPNN